MMEFKLDNNIISVKKHSLNSTQDLLKFELHAYGETQGILKEVKAFKIDESAMSECLFLTKYFGPYHITKTNENRFIFSKQNNSVMLSKYKW